MSKPSNTSFLISILLSLGLCAAMPLPAETGYQKPPQAVLDILNAPAPPQILLSPARDQIALVDTVRYPSIAELAQPMLRLAGERINPNTNGMHRPPRITALTLVRISDGKSTKVTLPANGGIGNLTC